jgi:hypothetical protein
MMSDEIEPFVVYRIVGGQMECALWRFQDGRTALALFLTEDTATSYRDAANLDAEWKVFRPEKATTLRELLKGCFDAGVAFAVLDPDQDKAKRIFDLRAILQLES